MEVNTAAYWSERYRRGETGWDLGAETPVFRALLAEGRFPMPPLYEGRQTRVLVPGCGYGHDVLLLARYGYEVIAVDFAPEPLHVLRERLQREGLSAELLCMDLFQLPEHVRTPVDVAVEYTCYCAIDPKRRLEYFAVMAQLIRPGGWLVGLFFPLSSEPPAVGPPFPVSREEVLQLAQQVGFHLVWSEVPVTSHPARLGREELMVFHK